MEAEVLVKDQPKPLQSKVPLATNKEIKFALPGEDEGSQIVVTSAGVISQLDTAKGSNAQFCSHTNKHKSQRTVVPIFICRNKKYSLTVHPVRHDTVTNRLIKHSPDYEYPLTSDTKVMRDKHHIYFLDDPDKMIIKFYKGDFPEDNYERPDVEFAKLTFEYIKHLISEANKL